MHACAWYVFANTLHCQSLCVCVLCTVKCVEFVVCVHVHVWYVCVYFVHCESLCVVLCSVWSLWCV